MLNRKPQLWLALGAFALSSPLALSPVVLSAFVVNAFSAPAAYAREAYSDHDLRAVEHADDAKIRELRDEEINQLRILLGRHQPANRQAELYLRLAEIYLEAYRSNYLLEGRVHEKKLEQGKADPFIDHSHSRPYLARGVQACQAILGFRIPFAKLDQVYYFLGFNYGELEQRAQSLKNYEYLTQHFPRSPFAGEAYREMGDAAFGQAQYRKAQGYYEAAVARMGKDSLPRLQHKLAWSYYRTKQFDRSVETMKAAIAGAQASGEKFVSLREEALRDMAIFMTETGRVEEAIAYFQSVAGDKAFYPKVLEKLGRQYERNVEPVKATQVYESLLKTHPDTDAGFRVLVKLVDLDFRRGRFKDALARLQNVQVPGARDDETVTATQNLRAMVRRTATEHHEKYRKTGDRAALELAEAYYGVYLRIFLSKDDPRQETPEIQMYLAEVKRDLGKSREASELYRKVVDSRDKRYAKEAGALWTASLAEAMKKSEAPKNGKTAEAQNEPSDVEKEFISASDSLQDALGETPEAREAALRAAEVDAGYKGSQKEAIKRIRKILARWPKSPQAVTAARLWIQIYADRLPPVGQPIANLSAAESAAEDIQDVLKEVRENAALIAADQEVGKGKLRQLMAEQDTRLKIFAIAHNEKDGDFLAAGKGYEAFAKESQQPEVAEKAYSNAMGAFIKISDLESADRVSSAWLKRFPKSGKVADALRGAATQFLIQGRFDSAAKLFEKLGLENDPASLETAARIFEGNGDLPRAQSDWSAYLERFKSSPHRGAIALRLARSLESSKQDGQKDGDAAKVYRECMASAEHEAECGSRLADLYLRSKNVTEARNLFKKVGALGSKGKGATSPFVGYARYRLAVMMEEDARFEPLQLPEAKLKLAMNQRLEYLEPLSRAYLAVVDAGGPWAIAALDRLALWATHFADDIDRIAPDAHADPAALAQFKKSLAGISTPLRKKAAQTWSEGYAKSVSFEVFSPVLPSIADRLADLGALGRAQGVRAHFRLAGLAADGGSDGLSAALENVRERLSKQSQSADAASAWVDYGNLLWGSGKPVLARLAYDRALSLNSKNPAALNNRAVVLLSDEDAEEDWLVASEAGELFLQALKQDDFFLPAKINRAFLLNYYRLFPKAKGLWEQVLVKSAIAENQAGFATALQGAGDSAAADTAFAKSHELGTSNSDFAVAYHEAARVWAKGSSDEAASRCLSRLSDIDSAKLTGFEKEAFERIQKACTGWKKDK